MTEPRISLMAPTDALEAATAAKCPPALADLSVFRMLFHNPQAARALNGMLHALLFKGRLDPQLRELVIMRIAWQRGAAYEWTHHWSFAVRVGLSEADVVGVQDWPNHAGFGPAARAVLAATDETLATGRITDSTWADCASALDQDEGLLAELVVVIGNWIMFAGLLLSLGVPLEDDVAPWPPAGVGPDTPSRKDP